MCLHRFDFSVRQLRSGWNDNTGSNPTSSNSSGSEAAELRYYPWGMQRYTSSTTLTSFGAGTPTTYRFTGQRVESGIGLYFYNARWYDAGLGRWIQPDTDVPESQGVQAYDRYAYTNNNPLKYIDPTGHTIGLPPVAIDPCRLNPEFCQELLNNESTPPNPDPPFDNSLGGNNTNTPSGTSGTPSSSTCPGAVAGGALLIIALAPIDFGLVVANIAVLDVPVLGPIVEVVILVPVDLAVIDLHFVGASILWQGSIKSCDDINVELLPPWGFDR